MKKNYKGFTLIELLVVIAIIGILASVVLASLNSARAKGQAAAIKANMKNMQPQAAIFYDTNGYYSSSTALSACTSVAGTLLGDSNVQAAITQITSAGASVQCSVSSGSSGKWAIYATSTALGTFCVDADGKSASSTGITSSACN